MKKVPLMTPPKGMSEKILTDGQRSLSRGKQKQKQQILLKQQNRSASPNIFSQTINNDERQTSKTPQLKRQLFPILQFKQFKSPQSKTSISNKPQYQIHQIEQKPNNGEGFQRSSINKSQKVYNVSLASARSTLKDNIGNNLSQSKIKTSFRHPQRSKSPLSSTQRKTSPLNLSNSTEQQAQKWLQSTLKTVKNMSIRNINSQFTQMIQRPLKIQSQISKSSCQLQRCSQHNTAYSLYCTMDRQLLCVACIYSQRGHKGHRLLPLNRAQKQMGEDIDAFKNRIDQTTTQSQHLIRQASLNLIKIQKSYPIIQRQIQSNFMLIHQMIDLKKNQQLEYIATIREQYKTELKVIGQLLNKINNVIVERVKMVAMQKKAVEAEVRRVKVGLQQRNYTILRDKQQQSQRVDDTLMNESLITFAVRTHCSYQTLSKYYKILQKHSDHLFDERQKFDVNISNFQQVQNLIKYKLSIVLPVFDKDLHHKSFGSFLNASDSSGGNNLVDGKKMDQNEERGKVKGKASRGKGVDDKDTSVKHKKEFSMSPQVPKGLSRRFL